ncbi:hypothetical protein EDB85DRAFT_1873290 [Lactarius pseudohatsudake]|nr:hypothetical protein EDB85DRAFT_1873290 [Lactarius pseudohatsudake]
MASDSSTPSKRWTQFYAALQLAIQSAAHKWTYKDFSECFPLWCEEQPNGAERVFKTVSSLNSHLYLSKLSLSWNGTDKLYEQYDVQERIDVLHGVVTEARTRLQRGETPAADRWHEDLQPREATRGRTIPTLERERDLLRARLAQVRHPMLSPHVVT